MDRQEVTEAVLEAASFYGLEPAELQAILAAGQSEDPDRFVNHNNQANPERDNNNCMIYRGVKR